MESLGGSFVWLLLLALASLEGIGCGEAVVFRTVLPLEDLPAGVVVVEDVPFFPPDLLLGSTIGGMWKRIVV